MMHLPAGQYSLLLPPIGQLVSVEVMRKGTPLQMEVVGIERLYELLEKGSLRHETPRYAALEGDTLSLYPIADIEYEVKIRYYPPLEEI